MFHRDKTPSMGLPPPFCARRMHLSVYDFIIARRIAGERRELHAEVAGVVAGGWLVRGAAGRKAGRRNGTLQFTGGTVKNSEYDVTMIYIDGCCEKNSEYRPDHCQQPQTDRISARQRSSRSSYGLIMVRQRSRRVACWASFVGCTYAGIFKLFTCRRCLRLSPHFPLYLLAGLMVFALLFG